MFNYEQGMQRTSIHDNVFAVYYINLQADDSINNILQMKFNIALCMVLI